MVLQSSSWWSIHVHLFQVIYPVFQMCFQIFYNVIYRQSVVVPKVALKLHFLRISLVYGPRFITIQQSCFWRDIMQS